MSKSIKEKINFYFEDVETFGGKLTDIIVIILVLISSAIFVALSYPVGVQVRAVLELVDTSVVILFSFEYALRLWVAKHKLRHMLNTYSLLDIAAILPFYLGLSGFTYMRIFRVLRILRLSRYLRHRYIFGKVTSEDAVVIGKLAYTLFAMIFVFSGLIYSVEHAVNPTRFNTFFDAVYYSIVTLTTVGFGDITPISVQGRVVTMVMIISGVVFIPLQLTRILRRIIHTAGKVKAVCKKCGEQ